LQWRGQRRTGRFRGHIRELLNTFPEIVAALSRPWERQMMNLRCAFCTFMFGARNQVHPARAIGCIFQRDSLELTLLGHDMAVENAVYEGALAQFMWPSLVPPTPSLPPLRPPPPHLSLPLLRHPPPSFPPPKSGQSLSRRIRQMSKKSPVFFRMWAFHL